MERLYERHQRIQNNMIGRRCRLAVILFYLGFKTLVVGFTFQAKQESLPGMESCGCTKSQMSPEAVSRRSPMQGSIAFLVAASGGKYFAATGTNLSGSSSPSEGQWHGKSLPLSSRRMSRVVVTCCLAVQSLCSITIDGRSGGLIWCSG